MARLATATYLLHELILHSADRDGEREALRSDGRTLSYSTFASACSGFAAALRALGLGRAERVATYLEKRHEMVVASFGASAAGGVFVPVNPILKSEQVRHILRDCGVRVLITSPERLVALGQTLESPELRHVVLTDDPAELPSEPGIKFHRWGDLQAASRTSGHRVIDGDMVAILYTSGSTGRPKGVVLSHRNMVCGAKSVAQYLENHRGDTLLAALPLSFDAGFSQLTTAFHVGARVVLLNYLLPRDVVKALAAEQVTGMTAVPPMWLQLAQLNWPDSIGEHLRYFATTGGRMPRETLTTLRQKLPSTKPFLMYGLTEAFRATYLPPDQVDARPDSIGKAIPNAEVLVVREDGSECAPGEPGELVQRGALVALGYWNNPEATAERFKALRRQSEAEAGLVISETAVYSGDTVRRDEDGYLYFIGRRDEMIKTSGYRVSPTEVEEVLYATGAVGECAAFGIADDGLGQVVGVVVTPRSGQALDAAFLLAECRSRLPAYMVPARIEKREGPLPRNANGKIDRKTIAAAWNAS